MSSPSAAAVPAALWRWLTALAEAVPARSALTFLELRVGAMISGRGFVTEAILAIAARRGWQAYYWWLEKGRWSWVAVARRLCSLLATDFPSGPWHLVIDDTLVPRASKKAPAAGTHFDHSRKPNRPTYIWGQGWVTLAAIVRGRSVASSWAVPLLSRLVRKGGNHGKLTTARVLLRTVRGLFGNARLFLDSWYMRASVIQYALAEGLTVIGQARKDLALYRPPPRSTRKRGRPAKRGAKMTTDAVAALVETRSFMFLYGPRPRPSATAPPSYWPPSWTIGRSTLSGSPSRRTVPPRPPGSSSPPIPPCRPAPSSRPTPCAGRSSRCSTRSSMASASKTSGSSPAKPCTAGSTF